jgi:hypothetical protein
MKPGKVPKFHIKIPVPGRISSRADSPKKSRQKLDKIFRSRMGKGGTPWFPEKILQARTG